MVHYDRKNGAVSILHSSNNYWNVMESCETFPQAVSILHSSNNYWNLQKSQDQQCRELFQYYILLTTTETPVLEENERSAQVSILHSSNNYWNHLHVLVFPEREVSILHSSNNYWNQSQNFQVWPFYFVSILHSSNNYWNPVGAGSFNLVSTFQYYILLTTTETAELHEVPWRKVRFQYYILLTTTETHQQQDHPEPPKLFQYYILLTTTETDSQKSTCRPRFRFNTTFF